MNLTAQFALPWAIHESAIDFLKTALSKAAPVRDSFLPPPKEPEVVDGIAVIPINGVLLRVADEFLQGLGFCSCESLAASLESAADNPAVRQILLVTDSPGGSVAGVPELAALVAEINARKKAVDVFCQGMCCSAAFWIAAGGRRILAAPSSVVGSIGCLVVYLDTSEAQKSAGVAVQIFRSGELKSPGIFGEKLSDQQRQFIQTQLSDTFQMFKEHVQKFRPKVSALAFDGRTAMAIKGGALGLVDRLAPSLKAVLSGVGPLASGNLQARLPAVAGFPSLAAAGAYRRAALQGRAIICEDLKSVS